MRGVTADAAAQTAYFQFQLTRLMRGVTAWVDKWNAKKIHFNSHASCEA